MRQKCDKIIAHGCNVFINRQLIYNLPESIFTEHGVMAIEHADFDGIERLAAVTGGEVVSTFDRPDLVTMGQCDVIEEVRETDACHFSFLLLYLSPLTVLHTRLYRS